MRHYNTPRDGRLRALEQNILRYRAMEMILALFYAESLRKTILGCVKDRGYLRSDEDNKPNPNRLQPGDKNPVKKALAILEKDRIYTAAECAEVTELLQYRNDIAHRLEELVGDIGAGSFNRSHAKYRVQLGRPQFKHGAVKKLKEHQELLYRRGSSKYTWELGLESLLFEGAEQALRTGLKRLDRTIRRQIKIREAENKKLKDEFSLKGLGFTGDLDPYHPNNHYYSGNLTARGTEVCYRLFDIGKSPLVVAYMMRMSLATMRRRHKMWKAAGGTGRKKVNIATLPVPKRYLRPEDYD